MPFDEDDAGHCVHWRVGGGRQRYVSAGLPGTGLSVRQYTPVNSSPKLSFWTLAIAAAVLAVLLISGAASVSLLADQRPNISY